MNRFAMSLAVMALLALPAAAGAAPSLLGPTGLLLTPTADTVGMASFNVGATGARVDDGPDETILYGNLGLLSGLEAGFTRERIEGGGSETIFNAKLRLFRPPLGEVSIAAGVLDITDQIDRTPYLVASHTLGAGVVTGVGPVTLPQIHLGVGGGRLDHVFGGLSTVVGRRVEVMAEYDGDDVNVGARLPLAMNLDATVAALGGLSDFAAGISFSGPW